MEWAKRVLRPALEDATKRFPGRVIEVMEVYGKSIFPEGKKAYFFLGTGDSWQRYDAGTGKPV
jgi:hypothetical protein